MPSAVQIASLFRKPLDFLNLVDEIPLGIIFLDQDLRVVHFNKAFEALSGTRPEKFHGVECCYLLRGAACVDNCPVMIMGSNKRSVSCKSDMITMERQKIPIRITTAPVLDSEGSISGYIETIQDIRTTEQLDGLKSTAFSFANIVGRSPQMEKIFQTLPLLAQTDTSILITGETGTGKDLVAEAIHQASEREAGPFVKINCGALPETLLESEIFGHEKGAFTGAVGSKPGRFRLAHNGTIFLTEIGDLPLSLQVKLLTFLDDRIIYPLGSTRGFNANVRIVAATNRNLEDMVKEGTFRKDLLFRLNVARIHLPPLREREGDIRLLLDHFFNYYRTKLGKSIRDFSKDSLSILLNYNYEGNIRELKNVVEYAVNVTSSSAIEPASLPSYIMESVKDTLLSASRQFHKHDMGNRHNAAEGSSSFPQKHAGGSGHSYAGSDDGLNDTAADSGLSPQTWPEIQRKMILDALIQAKGKKNDAAKILGWGRSTLWRKIKKYHIQA